VNSHDVILDEIGVEFVALEAAEAEALKAIQELREEDGEACEGWQGWQLHITDQAGSVLQSMSLDPARQQWTPKPLWRKALAS
jgi:hypothetical protein